MGKKTISKKKLGYLSPEEKVMREKRFTLDCVALGTLSTEAPKAFSPKLATAIPPYNAQRDKIVNRYFERPTTKQVLKKTGQFGGGDSLLGKQADFFNEKGHLGKYIAMRNASGAGYSTIEVAGHELFMSNPKPVIGYNGPAGYRRNTPELRCRPSCFDYGEKP